MRWRMIMAAAVLCVALPASAQQPNSLTAAEATQGWKLLFDGKSLTGWTPLPTSSASKTGDWRVAGGALLCPGQSPGWLASSQTFGDFVLTLEFRGAANVNSGVFIRSSLEGQPHLTGHEIQIWDHQPAGYNTGSLVGTLKAKPTSIVPDQWNALRITAAGDHFTVALNGKTLLDGHDSSRQSSGRIGLQCQPGNRIEFRNIKIRPDR